MSTGDDQDSMQISSTSRPNGSGVEFSARWSKEQILDLLRQSKEFSAWYESAAEEVSERFGQSLKFFVDSRFDVARVESVRITSFDVTDVFLEGQINDDKSGRMTVDVNVPFQYDLSVHFINFKDASDESEIAEEETRNVSGAATARPHMELRADQSDQPTIVLESFSWGSSEIIVPVGG